MFSSIKLFCLLSSVWHVSAMAVPTTSHIDDHVDESSITDVTTADMQPNLDDYCWSKLLHSCSIIGNFTRTTIALSFPVNIDCSVAVSARDANELQRPHLDQYFYDHFQHVEVIALNGCGLNVMQRMHASNYQNGLGIEYIPDPMSVRHLTLEMFKIRGDLNRGAFLHFKNTKALLLMNNKIDRLNEGSFDGLSRVEELIMQENRIESMHSATFKPCTESLVKLVIRESHLKLGELEPLPKISDLTISTKQLNWTALTIGINSLNTAVVSNVAEIVYNKSSALRTFKNLTKLEVIFCGLQEFPIDRYPRLQQFNISHNALSNVSVKEMQMLGLHTLDISHNKFVSIDGTLLTSLWDLEYLYATHNQIIGVNPKAFQKNYNLKIVDLRYNRLKRLPIDTAIFVMARHLKLQIDHNKFDCTWINDYYGLDPNIFTSKFAYTKDYSDVNIKGLRCIYYNGEFRYHSHLYDDDDQFHNGIKPRRQPHPVEILRRNPKQTAFLTICILIVGVSSLLISLFFYVKYRTLTTTLNSNAIYDNQKLQNKDKGNITAVDTSNRPDIIQDRVMSVRQNDMFCRLQMPKSASSPRSIEQHLEGADDHDDDDEQATGIEFKDFVGKRISEQRKASLPNRFECVPIGTHKVIFNIEPDSLEN